MALDHFGEHVAARYDASTAEMFDRSVVDPTVEFLAELAGGGDALALGIGTGRIAQPLCARGVRVRGIDLSEAMVARLREKPGGDEIEVTIGDFATTRVEGAFQLAYLVFNTIQNLTTQEEQVACFRNARQGLISHHDTLADDRFELRSIPFRYVWPAELDLMAWLAGMTLRERWGDWTREPFTSDSSSHVSVWTRLKP